MKLHHSIATVALVGFTFLATNASLQAAPISVPNFSFENPSLGAGNSIFSGTPGDFTTIPDWVVGGDDNNAGGGIATDNSRGLTSSIVIPNGVQYGYIATAPTHTATSTSPTTLTSAASLAVISATTYTLTVDVGSESNGFASSGTFEIELLDNGVSVASNTLAGSLITPGTFQALSLDYTPSSGFGDQLKVRLSFSDTDDTNYVDGAFDIVRLSTPEPATSAMLLAGLSLLAVLIRRNATRA